MGRDAQPGPVLRARVQVRRARQSGAVSKETTGPLQFSVYTAMLSRDAAAMTTPFSSPAPRLCVTHVCCIWRECAQFQPHAALPNTCRYYQEKGFWVIVTARVLNLLALGFTAAFSGFLLLCVNWGALRAECIQQDTCDILEVRHRLCTLSI